jgi:cellulose synthase/poly-beta-1,6-N-acetylglucosamine synthase-like glycosyltransferase
MMTVFYFALLVPVALALVSSAVAYWQGWSYFSEGESGNEPMVDGASVIVPVRGAPEGLADLLKNLLSQEGVRPLEVIVAVEETDGRAALYVRRLAEKHERLQVVVAEEKGVSATGKIGNLIAGVSQATHDRLAFVDADVRLEPGALRALLRPLSDPSLGVSFAAQVGAESPNLPTAFSHIYVNDSAFQQAAAAWRGDPPSAVGAFLATRRDVLDSVGGLTAFADQIVMDIPLGQAAKEEGYDLYMLRRPVRVGGSPESWADVLQRQHRWMVSIKAYIPSFAAYIALAALPETWSLLFLAGAILRDVHIGTGLLAFGIVLVWKVGSAAFANAVLAHDRGLWPRLWVALIGEMIWLSVFLWSLASTRVYWAGRAFDVGSDGTKRLIEPMPS